METNPARQLVVSSVAATVGFLGMWGFLRQVVPPPPIPMVSEKLAAFAAASPPYDLIHIGNSRPLFQLDPQVFDREVGRAGGPDVKSYNFGVLGMTLFETHYMLRRLLSDPATRLRWVVWDVSQRVCPPRRNTGTVRFAHWHDTTATWLACRYELAQPVDRSIRLARVRKHLASWADNLTGRGQLVGYLERALAREEPPTQPPINERGYLAMEDDPSLGVRRRRRNYLAALDQGSWLPVARPDTGSGPDLDMVAEVVDLITASGAEAVLLVSPKGDERSGALGREVRVGQVPVHRFDDRERYPALHAADAFYDHDHLNRAGSRLLTQELAAEFVARHTH